jgi:hypothetical protein
VSARYHCGTEGRRAAVRANVNFNGIEYVEIPAGHDQLWVEVHFLKDAPGLGGLTAANFAIEGGVRIKGVHVVSASAVKEVFTLVVDRAGDYSTYTLRLQKSESDPTPPDHIDPQLSSVELFFKIDCPSDFDCAELCDCPVPSGGTIDIDYLAKDYESFRRVMLDRMALTLPDWRERNPADTGIALVETLAWVADLLSYEQDAVATEAYLTTARKRTSVRRHARLLDYPVDDGANARVWVCLTVKGATVAALPEGTQLVTRVEGLPPVIDPDLFHAEVAESSGALIYETIGETPLFRELHNEMHFYTWSSSACCLPAGSTRATLEGEFPNLKKGHVLVLREKLGTSGTDRDADPTHAHPVRLVRDAEVTTDPVTGTKITELEWYEEDRLPFPLCVSLELSTASIPDAGVVHGNVVAADHGRTVRLPLKTFSEELDPVPELNPALARARRGSAACGSVDRQAAPLRFRPRLAWGPVTHAARIRLKGESALRPFDPSAPAAAAMRWTGKDVVPQVRLQETTGRKWNPQRDLLGSDSLAPEFVVETEDDGSATLRFGDDQHGRRPDQGTTFRATYRIGNGARGNIGSGAIRHIVSKLAATNITDGFVSAVNYTPARGGSDPESTTDIRLKAPVAFRRQERAVTPADYEEVATRHRDVQRAAATFRWTGSWYTVYITVDRKEGRPVDKPFREELARFIDRYRMAGYDLEIEAPHFVAIDLEIFVCVLPDYFRADVHRALLDAFSSRLRADGKQGFFHPDRFTFGQPVYLSQLYDAAHEVTGVQSIEITSFHRRGLDDESALTSGQLKIDRLEIARLDNDPNFPENGTLLFRFGGGR